MKPWRTISEDGQVVTLQRFTGLSIRSFEGPDSIDSAELKVGCSVDVETTGPNRARDEVIEIGLRQFFFSPVTGEILGIGQSYSQLKEISEEDSERVQRLTGITRKESLGKQIDWASVTKFLTSSHLIVAHNAGFDRSLIDRSTEYSTRGVWSCSMRQIDWISRGFPSLSLQMLLAYHGYFATGHRALPDADLVIHLLHQDPTYLLELYENAHEPRVRVSLLNTDYEDRHQIKKLNFFWNPIRKAWTRIVPRNLLPKETEQLEKMFGTQLKLEIEEIPISDNFRY